MFAMILDYVVIILLVATVTYCWRLNRRIRDLHESRGDLAKFIDDFNVAINSAERNISELKEQGQIADDNLKELINKGQFMANDLSFLVEKGESIAGALEQYITASRNLVGGANSGQRRPKTISKQMAAKPPAADKKDASVYKKQPKAAAESAAISPSKRQMLDDMLKQISQRKERSSDVNNPATGAEALAVRKVKKSEEA